MMEIVEEPAVQACGPQFLLYGFDWRHNDHPTTRKGGACRGPRFTCKAGQCRAPRLTTPADEKAPCAGGPLWSAKRQPAERFFATEKDAMARTCSALAP